MQLSDTSVRENFANFVRDRGNDDGVVGNVGLASMGYRQGRCIKAVLHADLDNELTVQGSNSTFLFAVGEVADERIHDQLPADVEINDATRRPGVTSGDNIASRRVNIDSCPFGQLLAVTFFAGLTSSR